MIVIIAAFVFALALAAGSAALMRHLDNARNEDYIWENYSVTVTLQYFDGTKKKVTTLINSPVVLDEPEPVRGYTFLGWENESGKILQPMEITAKIDEVYTARYIFALDTEHHVPYLFADELGLFHADDPLSRADAAQMIWSVLAEKPEPEGRFEDVEPDSACAKPAGMLKDLGICTDRRFYPEDPVSRGELIRMLASFYPPASGTFAFSDITEKEPLYGAFCTAAERGWIGSGAEAAADPYAILTRIEAVRLMNRVLGRDSAQLPPEEFVGGILEYKPEDEYYLPLVEAAVGHEYELSAAGEKWTSGDALEKQPEGRFFHGGRLYYIDADGHFARDFEQEGFLFDGERDTLVAVDGFRFGSDGVYTTGDPELDALLYGVIDSLYREGMSREELLQELFEYTVSSFKYLRRNYYKYGDTTFAPKEALLMLSTGKGNCYSYAGTFCMLARALGYDAVVFSGTVGREYEPHGWCEIIEDGTPYICDPELVMLHRRSGKNYDMFFKLHEELKGWMYIRYTRK